MGKLGKRKNEFFKNQIFAKKRSRFSGFRSKIFPSGKNIQLSISLKNSPEKWLANFSDFSISSIFAFLCFK